MGKIIVYERWRSFCIQYKTTATKSVLMGYFTGLDPEPSIEFPLTDYYQYNATGFRPTDVVTRHIGEESSPEVDLEVKALLRSLQRKRIVLRSSGSPTKYRR